MNMCPTLWNRPGSLNGFDEERWTHPPTMLKTSAIEEKLRTAVGPQNLRAATESDHVSGVFAQFVVEPDDERQLAHLLAAANEADITVIPRGGGTKLDWGNPPKRADAILSLAKFNRIEEHAWADLTVTVEAGCTLEVLQSALAKHGQRLACDCLWPERATIGGVLSTNDSGALRLRFGALRDLIIGVTIALSDGTLARSGGRVVKNVAGYDLPKLATGALGTLGIITRAVFRVHPIPHGAKSFSFTADNFETLQRQVLSIQDSQLAHSSLQICCRGGGVPRADILFEATEAGINAQEAQLRKLLGSTEARLSPESIWKARQELWAPSLNPVVIGKVCVLPAKTATIFGVLGKLVESNRLNWHMVMQATGIGTLSLEGGADQLSITVKKFRADVEGDGGSFVILRRPKELEFMDAWGNPGDAVGLMRAVKRELDPKSTLNPGRFVAGI